MSSPTGFCKALKQKLHYSVTLNLSDNFLNMYTYCMYILCLPTKQIIFICILTSLLKKVKWWPIVLSRYFLHIRDMLTLFMRLRISIKMLYIPTPRPDVNIEPGLIMINELPAQWNHALSIYFCPCSLWSILPSNLYTAYTYIFSSAWAKKHLPSINNFIRGVAETPAPPPKKIFRKSERCRGGKGCG